MTNEKNDGGDMIKPEGEQIDSENLPGVSHLLNFPYEIPDFKRFLKGLKPHDHLCLVYETEQEWQEVVVHFIGEGLEKNEKCLYVTGTHGSGDLLNLLETAGTGVAAAMEKGQLGILSEAGVYSKDGRFDPVRMIESLILNTKQALEEGYSALRVTGEMSWALNGTRGADRLIEYETRLNSEFFPHHQCLAICRYDRRKFNAGILKHVIMSHPLLVWKNKVFRNFYYVPADTSSGEIGDEVLVDTWLSNLDDSKRISETLKIERDIPLRLALEETDEDTWDWDMETNGIRLSDGWIRILGYDPGERSFDFKWWSESIHPESGPVFEKALADYLEGRAKYYELEYRILDKARQWHWIWARGVVVERDGDGNPSRMIGTHRDITVRKQTELALEERENRFKTTVENLPAGAVYRDGDRIYINRGVEDLTGYSKQELPTLDAWFQLLYKENAQMVRDIYESHITERFPVTQIVPVIRKDGETRWVEFAGSYVEEEKDIWVLFDITERKMVEEELKASLQEKEILLKEIHHRVKNNMAVTSSLLSLQAHEEMDEHVKEVLNAGRDRIQAMALVHEKMYQAGNLSAIDLAQYGRQLGTQLCSLYRVDDREIILEVSGPEIVVDLQSAIPFSLIICELLTNALKHAFPGRERGEIKLEFSSRLENPAEGGEPVEQVGVKVRDNGTGVPAGIDFYDSSTLGFKLVQMLTRQLHGTVTMNRETEGTTFEISFPNRKGK